jgi:predicted proteasome-type protease
MTYCVGVKLKAGLVFLSDSRTNAGVDHISTFRKMIVYERPGDRFMVMLTAGNLSISQSVREVLQTEQLTDADGEPLTIWNARSMFDAARVLGQAVRRVYDRDGESLRQAGVVVFPVSGRGLPDLLCCHRNTGDTNEFKRNTDANSGDGTDFATHSAANC